MEPLPREGTAGFRIRRGLRKIYHRLLPRSMTRFVMRGGIHYACPYSTFMRRIVDNGHLEREQPEFLFNESRRRGARVFLDVGANFGYYSLLAARLGVYDEIHAIEPHPDIYKQLLWHIKANNFEGVITPHNVAASDKTANVRFSAVASPLARVCEDDSAPDAISVKAAPLDSIFDFRGRNICLKIDVEGHELAALNGMKDLLANNRAFMQIELWHENTPFIAELLSRELSIIGHYHEDFYFVN